MPSMLYCGHNARATSPELIAIDWFLVALQSDPEMHAFHFHIPVLDPDT